MIGLRRDTPDRQGNPIPPATKGQEYPPLQCEHTKIAAPWSLGGVSAQSMVFELFARRHGRASSAISAIGQYLNETYADLLRRRDRNSAIILRHDHNPAKYFLKCAAAKMKLICWQ
jgi:hypothetical protein